MKHKNIIFAFFMIMIILISISCEQDIHDAEIKNELVKFESIQDYQNLKTQTVSMSPQQLDEFEKEKGFKSFGKKCDEFYNNIDISSFNSLEEIKQFVAKNSNYIQLIEDGNGEFELETKLYNRPDRYILNGDNMFQVGTSVYKVIDDCVVVGNEIDIETFYAYNDNLDSYVGNNKFSIIKNTGGTLEKSVTTNCGTGNTWRKTDGNKRLKVVTSVSNPYVNNTVTCHFIARSYKLAIVWVWETRIMSADVSLNYSFKYNTDDGFRLYENELFVNSGPSNVQKIEGTQERNIGFVLQDSEKFASYDVYVTSAGAPDVDDDCGI